MNLQTVENVRRVLHDMPLSGESVAARAFVGREEAYRALVWLYDRGQAQIARKSQSGSVAGWVCAFEEDE